MTYEIDASALPVRASVPSRLRRVGAAVGDAFGSALRRLLAAEKAWKERRHLHDLDEYLLRDVGLRRDQIDDALRGDVRRQADRLRQHGG